MDTEHYLNVANILMKKRKLRYYEDAITTDSQLLSECNHYWLDIKELLNGISSFLNTTVIDQSAPSAAEIPTVDEGSEKYLLAKEERRWNAWALKGDIGTEWMRHSKMAKLNLKFDEKVTNVLLTDYEEVRQLPA